MKLKKDIDTVAFLSGVKKCTGDVAFETKEGDWLNLKSILSQYLFAALEGKREVLDQGSVVCKVETDYAVLSSYLEKEE